MIQAVIRSSPSGPASTIANNGISHISRSPTTSPRLSGAYLAASRASDAAIHLEPRVRTRTRLAGSQITMQCVIDRRIGARSRVQAAAPRGAARLEEATASERASESRPAAFSRMLLGAINHRWSLACHNSPDTRRLELPPVFLAAEARRRTEHRDIERSSTLRIENSISSRSRLRAGPVPRDKNTIRYRDMNRERERERERERRALIARKRPKRGNGITDASPSEETLADQRKPP